MAMAEEEDAEMKDKQKQKNEELEKESDPSEELGLKSNVHMLVERISKVSDPAVQVAFILTSCYKLEMCSCRVFALHGV